MKKLLLPLSVLALGAAPAALAVQITEEEAQKSVSQQPSLSPEERDELLQGADTAGNPLAFSPVNAGESQTANQKRIQELEEELRILRLEKELRELREAEARANQQKKEPEEEELKPAHQAIEWFDIQRSSENPNDMRMGSRYHSVEGEYDPRFPSNRKVIGDNGAVGYYDETPARDGNPRGVYMYDPGTANRFYLRGNCTVHIPEAIENTNKKWIGGEWHEKYKYTDEGTIHRENNKKRRW